MAEKSQAKRSEKSKVEKVSRRAPASVPKSADSERLGDERESRRDARRAGKAAVAAGDVDAAERLRKNSELRTEAQTSAASRAATKAIQPPSGSGDGQQGIAEAALAAAQDSDAERGVERDKPLRRIFMDGNGHAQFVG